MKRRTLIAGLSSLTASSVFAVGSGAFTSVSAKRRLKVDIADDNNALLALEELGTGERSKKDGSQVEFSFPSLEERFNNPGLGLGTDSIYEFDRDADESQEETPTEGLLRITNQGTQPVEVYSVHESDSELEIELYDVTDADETALKDELPTLDVGDSIDVGFRIRTFDVEIGTFDETLTIVAKKPDD